MKRIWTVWMLAVLLALSAFPARAAMIAGGEGGSQASSLALLASPEEALQVLRSRPSAEADNLGYYFNGVYAGVVSGPQKGWVQVAIGSLTGYLREEDLIIDPPADIAAAELPTVKVAYKDGPRLTIRAEQNYQSEKLGSYENGTEMTVLGFTEDFAHVMGPDQKVGFMMAWGVDPQLTVSAAREEAEGVLAVYFGRTPTDAELAHCLAYVALAAYYWFVWAIYQEVKGNSVDEYLYLWYRYAQSFSAKALAAYEQLVPTAVA